MLFSPARNFYSNNKQINYSFAQFTKIFTTLTETFVLTPKYTFLSLSKLEKPNVAFR